MKVLKFGGTSVGSTGGIRAVVDIIASCDRPLVAVFPAFSGVTNILEKCMALASQRNAGYPELLSGLENRHIAIVREIVSKNNIATVSSAIKKLTESLTGILNGISTTGELTLRSSDLVLGFGEQMSMQVISAVLKEKFDDIRFVDARGLIYTKLIGGTEQPEMELTQKAIRERMSPGRCVCITSGYIATSVMGYPTTLGRGGSDQTASLIASALNAEQLEVWTNVSGIYTADPAYTEDAFPIAELSYAEALEISHFGAKLINPPSIQHVMERKIPVIIRNTFAPCEKGTMITCNTPASSNSIKAITALDRISLVSLTGAGLAGSVGIASRMFSAMAANNINVILITQASSEQSICVAVQDISGRKACEVINNEFEFEIRAGRVNPATLETGYSIIALIGESMKHTVGISGQTFSALGKNGVNIHAIAQGSSELNISAVIKSNDCCKAVNAIHQEFFRSVNKVINLFIVGTGNVGSAFIEQVVKQSAYFVSEYQIEFRITGLANSRKMVLDRKGIQDHDWMSVLMKNGRSYNIDIFMSEMFELNLPNTIFVDNTSSKSVAGMYVKILTKSISVVTCNKIAASESSYNDYNNLKKTAIAGRVHFKFETNVGAGLPIIKTIENLIKTGDKLYRIDAVLSGSLNYIFNCYCNGMKFSDAVIKAVKEKYTEPDPFDDLRGMDIVRKLLILVREAGIILEASDIRVENFLPFPLPDKYDPGSFLHVISEYDDYFEKFRKSLVGGEEKLRVIARYADQKAGISLEKVSLSHLFFNLEGNDNIVSLYSKRYSEQPLIIKGAGAGSDVTASGIFADILSIINN